jgi:type II secretion system protein N
VRWLKRLTLLLLLVILIPVGAFWGLKQSFPGETIAQKMEQYASQQSGIPFKLAPLQLGWTALEFPELAMLTPPGWRSGPPLKMLVLEQARAPFAALPQLEGRVEGQVHGGTLQVKISPLPQPQTAQIQLQSVQLQRVPLVALFPYGTISGELSSELEVNNLAALLQRKTSLPQGELQGNLSNLRVRLAGLDLLLPGSIFPDLVWSRVHYELELGEQVVLRQVEFEGSVEGSLSGTVRPNLKRPSASQLDLKVQLKIPAELLQALGPLALVLRPYQCGVELRVRVQGSPERPVTRPGVCS